MDLLPLIEYAAAFKPGERDPQLTSAQGVVLRRRNASKRLFFVDIAEVLADVCNDPTRQSLQIVFEASVTSDVDKIRKLVHEGDTIEAIGHLGRTSGKARGVSLFCQDCHVIRIAPGCRRLFCALKELHQKLWSPEEVFRALPAPSTFFRDFQTLLHDRIQRALQVDHECAAKGAQGKQMRDIATPKEGRNAPKRQDGLVVVCEAIANPLNLCAVLRVCDAFGVTKAIFVNASLEKLKPAVQMRASASSSKWVIVEHYRSTTTCLEALKKEDYQNLGAALHTTNPLSLYDPTLGALARGKVALWFGNEADGLSNEAMSGMDRSLYIPMLGAVESLNLSVCCGIVVSEMTRLRLSDSVKDA